VHIKISYFGHSLIRFRVRFYPGISFPSQPLITGSDKPPGSIEAPEVDRTEFESPSGRADINGRHIRATRVVGSLDHAVLPMPPVCGCSI
jgi:hypothetical protein